MKKNLYVDFDGVILDTITVTYKWLKEKGIDRKDTDICIKFFQELDWEDLVNTTPQINESITCIKKIISSNLFNVSVLTHVTSEKEAIAKKGFMNKHIPELEVISVNKSRSKTEVENIIVTDSYLVDDFSGNLREWEACGGIGIKFSLEEEKECPFLTIDRLDTIVNLVDNNIGVN